MQNNTLNATFVMEQHIGHRAYYENLRRFIDPVPTLQARWVEVTYESESSRWGQLPLLPQHLRGSLIGREQVRRGLSHQHADVAVFNTQVPAALGGGLVGHQPYILCTDITPLQYDEMAEHYGHQPDSDGFVKRYKHRANLKLMQGAAKVVPWSHWTAESVIHDYGVAPERVEVVSPGVDLDVWQPAGTRPSGPMRILFVGGDLHRKGGDDLLNAFRQLPQGLATLVLVTRTELPPEPGVEMYHHLQPNSPELIQLYHTAHLFALPTKAEAFGIAAVEASAMGLPVVATAVGGLTDIVVDGETGLTMPPGDVDTLAAHLRLLAENEGLRTALGRGARARAEERFDAKVNASRMVDLLRETVARGVSA